MNIQNDQIILEEIYDDEPSEDEIIEYAEFLGISHAEVHLFGTINYLFYFI